MSGILLVEEKWLFVVMVIASCVFLRPYGGRITNIFVCVFFNKSKLAT